MAWVVGYSGTCPGCGASLHHVAADKAGMTTLWLRCASCARADAVQVPDAGTPMFWSRGHPCGACGAQREPWCPSRCPRCGQEDAGRFVCMPD